MKTSWKIDTVYAGRPGHAAIEWLRAKQTELENKTGVKWSWEPAHGECVFHPYMTKEDALVYADEGAAERILAWLNSQGAWHLNYKSLLGISEGTGLPLTVVCGTCWALANSKDVPAELKVNVNRMGKPCFVALVR